ncbi:MAG: gamma-glutamyltransferase [Deltaproteobacteria bacterium]|nr:gamma-glutamyltransferase [Deltaproteobacteria bacterium]
MIKREEINLADPKYHPGPKPVVTGKKAVCSTDNAIVTNTILGVMKAGGNAADAGIAGCMVQATIEPFMTNHTGTVTFLYYEAATGKTYQLDSTGTFPPDLPPFKPVPQMPSGYSAMPPSACIPGFMPGLKEIHHRFGTQPWAALCEDAVYWAEAGHHVSTFEYYVNAFGKDFVTYFPEGRKFYMPDGHMVPVGKRFSSSEMAQTLKRVAEAGPDYMISGQWADKFVKKANDMGWKITREHLTDATPPRWIEPLKFKHHEYEVVSLAPPQQQGVFCAIVLGILSQLGIRDLDPGSADAIYYMAHALRWAQQQCGYLGDPQIEGVPLDELLDSRYHKFIAGIIQGARPKVDLTSHVAMTAIPGGMGGFTGTGGEPTGANSHQDQPSGSCELSIVDTGGNWVQMMNTLQSGGIPGMVIDGIPMVGSHASFNIINSPMDQKLVKGARMRTVMGNTIVFKDGKPCISMGSPGNVHCTVPQVLTNVLDFKMTPYDAAAAPRLLNLGEDSSITIEDRVSPEALKALAALGVKVRATPTWDMHMGSFQMCWRDEATGGINTTVDPRRCGWADGF